MSISIQALSEREVKFYFWLNISLLLILFVSIAGLVYYMSDDAITAFSDGQSRLMIARGIRDSLTPSIEQSGLIWPPVPQWMMFPFAQNDYLYNTGLAGAIPSMFCFLVMAYHLYRFTSLMTNGNSHAAFIAVVASITPSVVYMQVTPMAELPFIAFTMVSAYYVAVWLRRPQRLALIPAGIATALACWTRYEGWIGFAGLFLILLYGAWSLKLPEKSRLPVAMFTFGVLPLVAIISWFVINYQVSGDPLYFLRSDYAPSVYAHQAMEALRPELRTKGNPLLSLQVYGLTTINNLGWITAALALLGIRSFCRSDKIPRSQKLVALWLLYPFPLFVFFIWQGGSVVILHPHFADGVNWGTRYGILMVPGASFFVGYLSSRMNMSLALLPVLVYSFGYSWFGMVNISYDEAVTNNRDGHDSVISAQAGDWLGQNYDGGLILIDTSGNERVAFESKIRLAEMVRKGNGSYWTKALDNPVGERWLVMRNSDEVWSKYHDSPVLQDRYYPVYDSDGIQIYKLK